MKKKINIFIIVLISISFLFGIFRLYERNEVEQNNKKYSVLINYDDLKESSKILDKDILETKKSFKDSGVTGILVKEKNLIQLQQDGKVLLYEAIELERSDINNYNFDNYYCYVPDENLRNRIFENLKYKEEGISLVGNYISFPKYKKNKILNLGIGFPEEKLNNISDENFKVSLQMREFEDSNGEKTKKYLADLSKIENIDTYYFNGNDQYFDEQGILKDFIYNNKFGYIEFFTKKQTKYLNVLKERKSLNINRMFTTFNENLDQTNIEKYILATSERKINVLFIKFLEEPEKNIVKNAFVEIKKINSTLEDKGFELTSSPKLLSIDTMNKYQFIFISLGIILSLNLVFMILNLEKLGYILTVATILFSFILFKSNLILYKQFLAFLATITYPVISILYITKKEERNFKNTIKNVAKAFLITLVGVVFVSSLLSYDRFLKGIVLFRGVKLAHLLPILVIPCLVYYKLNKKDILGYIDDFKEVLNKNIKVYAAILMGLFALIALIYLIRTGNSGSTFPLELQFRSMLRKLFNVRPRTKEFLIGYPALVWLIKKGYNKFTDNFVLVFAIISQISFINTYAHLHTPIMISIQRSIIGLFVGLIIGLSIVKTYEFIKRSIVR